jgi:hypothetical protein
MTTSHTTSHTDDTDLRYLRRSFIRHLAADAFFVSLHERQL